MREFGILGAEDGMGGSFADITGLASGCRHRNPRKKDRDFGRHVTSAKKDLGK